MQILNTIDLGRKISKSLLHENGNTALILFDGSSEFAILNILHDELALAYYHKFDFAILDACFSGENYIWFALDGAINMEWSIDTRTISRTCGEVVNNNLAPHLKGYSCIRVIASRNLLIAANAGSFKIEFYHLDSLSKLDNADALCEVYTKNIIIHPNEQIIAVQVTESEDSGHIRFYQIKDVSIRLYKKYIFTLFSPSSCRFSEHGDQFITTGGFPPFSYQANRFPSLEFVNEFTDDEGLTLPTPWGNIRGITFYNDFLISSSKLIVPYYDGHLKYIELETGKIIKSIKCCHSLCNSLTRSQNAQLLLCSSLAGEVVLIRNDDLDFSTTSDTIILKDTDTTTNLLVPLAELEEYCSTLDDPVPIIKIVT
ncbi:hypothetical protein [Sphingobacterium suaedae]|uniref:DUF4905 domain-containing protein n=1 Tax=Sphingobacterium suaedae TaxID=1686402 RepID=A0ABW5KM82_9SPHI